MNRYLQTRLTTPARFRLPVTTQSAFLSLQATYANEVRIRNLEPIMDQPTIQHIQHVAEWITAPKPKFGMLICGHCGNGKTTLIRALRTLLQYIYHNQSLDKQHYIRIVEAKEIVRLAKQEPDKYRNLCNTEMLAIDDFGTEPTEVIDYGNILNPVIDLLTTRYNDQLFTIITTNLTPPQVREHYGDRIADRFNEMMDRIVFDNPSYRNINNNH